MFKLVSVYGVQSVQKWLAKEFLIPVSVTIAQRMIQHQTKKIGVSQASDQRGVAQVRIKLKVHSVQNKFCYSTCYYLCGAFYNIVMIHCIYEDSYRVFLIPSLSFCLSGLVLLPSVLFTLLYSLLL